MTSQNPEERNESEELLRRARECKGKNFKKLLKEIENAIEKSKVNDEKLLRAKKVVTARMSSRRTKEKEMMEPES
jgi:cation transport regulator ChaC